MSDEQFDLPPQPVVPEEVAPILIDSQLAKLGLTQRLWRAPFGGSGGGRFYFRKGFDDFYAGYSLWTKSVLGNNPGLVKWQIAMGEQGEIVSLAAREYGSAFHLFVARHESLDDPYQFSVHGKSSAEWKDYLRGAIDEHGLPRLYFEKWCDQLRNDMVAYFRWKAEHSVRVLAVECPVWHDEYRIATPCDMLVQCLIKASPYAKAPTVPVVAAVDFKTGENGCDYDEYKLQLGFIQMAWNELYKGTPYEITAICNWSPKKRNLSPAGYHFPNQTGRYTEEQVRHYAKTCALMGFNRPTGSVLVFNDTPEGPTLEVEKPHNWLRNFFTNQ